MYFGPVVLSVCCDVEIYVLVCVLSVLCLVCVLSVCAVGLVCLVCVQEAILSWELPFFSSCCYSVLS